MAGRCREINWRAGKLWTFSRNRKKNKLRNPVNLAEIRSKSTAQRFFAGNVRPIAGLSLKRGKKPQEWTLLRVGKSSRNRFIMAAEQKEKEKKLGNSRWPNDVVSAALVRRLFICFFFLFFSFFFFWRRPEEIERTPSTGQFHVKNLSKTTVTDWRMRAVFFPNRFSTKYEPFERSGNPVQHFWNKKKT